MTLQVEFNSDERPTKSTNLLLAEFADVLRANPGRWGKWPKHLGDTAWMWVQHHGTQFCAALHAHPDITGITTGAQAIIDAGFTPGGDGRHRRVVNRAVLPRLSAAAQTCCGASGKEEVGMSTDLVFLDTECLGLELDSPIWECAAIRRDENGVETELAMFIDHEPGEWLADLPESFRADYGARYDPSAALPQAKAAQLIHLFLAGRPHIVGAVPNFDTERISRQLLRPAGLADPWHYHLADVQTMAVGYLHGLYRADWQQMPIDPPGKSDELSRAIGVDPEDFDRHTAMGDVLWVRAQYDAITNCGAWPDDEVA